MKDIDERIKWIDIARSFAIFSVVLCHATEHIYKFNLDYIQSISFKSRVFAVNAFVAGRLGVPFFMMISGYLLLGKTYDKQSCRRFWKHNLLHLLICTEIWYLIYHLFLWLIKLEAFSFKHLIDELLFLRQVKMEHIWYLPMIIGMYILIPYVANAVNSMDVHNLIFPFMVYVITSMGFTIYNAIINTLQLEPVSQKLSSGFSGGAYGLYIVSGYCIRKGMLKKINSKVLILCSMLCFVFTSGFMLWTYHQGYMYSVWYDNFTLFFCTVCGFELFSRFKTIRYCQYWRFLAKYAFSIYLIHNIMMYLIKPIIRSLIISKPIKVFLMWVLSYLFSLLLSVLIERVPKVGTYILYLK